jgi:hypothetical protein
MEGSWPSKKSGEINCNCGCMDGEYIMKHRRDGWRIYAEYPKNDDIIQRK